MKASPLQLERHFFTRVHLDAHRAAQVNTRPELVSEVEVALAPAEPKRYQVTLRLRLLQAGDKRVPYTAEIHVVGLVRVADDWPEEKAVQLVEANGAALLYGAAREMLCNLTARGPWPMVSLHAVTFVKPGPPVSSAHGSAAAALARP